MLNFEINWVPGMKLGYTARRPGQHDLFDFTPGVNRFLPRDEAKTPANPLDEMTGLFEGTYATSFGPTPGVEWWSGDIIITVHDLGTRLADGTTTRPSALFSFNAPFDKGSTVYSSPPFYTY